MFEAGAITGEIDITEAPTVRNFRNLERESATMKNRVQGEMDQAAKGGEKSFKDSVANINSILGKRSALGVGLKLAMGGGAIAGLKMAVNAFDELTGSIEQTATKLRLGDISFNQAVEQFAFGIPIIGGLAKGFGSLAEAITGEKAAMEAANRERARGLELRKQERTVTEHRAKAGNSAVAHMGDLAERASVEAAASGRPDATGLAKTTNANFDKMLAGQVEASKALHEGLASAGATPEDIKRLQQNVDFGHKNSTPKGVLEEWEQQLADATETSVKLQDKYNQTLDSLETTRQNENRKAQFADLGLNREASGPKFEPDVIKDPRAALEEAYKNAAAHEKQFQQLPNARTQGEEIFGRRTVTGADMPSAFQETAESAKQTAKNTADIAAATQTLADSQRAGPPAPLIIDPP